VEREPVTSSLINSVGYDPSTHTLEVEFQDGDVYRYAGVPEFLYRGLLVTPSKGAFLHTRILGRFEHRRVD
jgi:hypothetical protein